MATDDGVIEAQALEDPNRLSVLTGCDLDLVATLAQALDDRPQHERVRGSSAVDPDPHGLSLWVHPDRSRYAASGESCG